MSDLIARMRAGDWYSCLGAELDDLRAEARAACFEHGQMHPDDRTPLGMAPRLRALLGHVGRDVLIENGFHCSYGFNTHLADDVFLNARCVVLDGAPVRIGARSMMGPGVQIITADHHRDPAKRAKGIERALPVTIGADVWLAAGVIVLPGVTIGDGAIVGAGAVVNRDIPAQCRVAGVPARALTGRDSPE
ncbi:sugar O-acetyltransferase [Aliiroseovarius sp. PTFE2010]|uniref:sugar O-acetyltransferase n=1 Tax=Aliiroseovarius sp. PTFE2010 TaxID=3417190 RepID=UPI003CF6597C